jgi:hypothetical protein
MRTFNFVTNRHEDACEVCSAQGHMRENDMVLCDTCDLLAQTEPEDVMFIAALKDRSTWEGVK